MSSLLFSLGTRRQLYSRTEPPTVRPPQTVAEFSLDKHGVYLDARYKRVLHPLMSVEAERHFADEPFDLSQGYEERELYRQASNLDYLAWLLERSAKCGESDLDKLCAGADIVTNRGTLADVLTTPYGAKWAEWQLVAHRATAGGPIFLCAFDTENRAADRAQQDADDGRQRGTYGAVKWAHCVGIMPRNVDELDVTEPVRQDETYHQVLQCGLGGTELLVCADIGAVAGDGTLVRGRTVKSTAPQWKVQDNLRRCWAQCALTHETVMLGIRGDVCHVHKAVPYNLDRMVAEGDFEPAVCMNFLRTVLDRVKGAVEQSGSGAVRVLKTAGRCDVDFYEVTKDELDDEYRFMSDEFKEHFGLH